MKLISRDFHLITVLSAYSHLQIHTVMMRYVEVISLMLMLINLFSLQGHVFDLLYILPFIKKYKVNPCTGKPLDAKGLIKLKFSKNAAGEFHCPVMFKVFNNSTHIAVIKTTGNVFCYEAIDVSQIKQKVLTVKLHILVSGTELED